MRGRIYTHGIGSLPDCKFQRQNFFCRSVIAVFSRTFHRNGSPAGERFVPLNFVIADTVNFGAMFQKSDPLI